MAFTTVTIASHWPRGWARVSSARKNLQGTFWKVITAEAEQCNESQQVQWNPAMLSLNHALCNAVSVKQLSLVLEEICFCQFVAGHTSTESYLNPVWDVTETGSQKGNGLNTFSEGCDTHVQHLPCWNRGLLQGDACPCMSCVKVLGFAADQSLVLRYGSCCLRVLQQCCSEA